MKFFSKNITEDITVVALFDENDGQCQSTDTTCQNYGCGNTVNVGVGGACL